MIQIYTDPLLLDFIKVCINMPADERAQLEAFTGEPYDVDRAAVGNWQLAGPKWVIKVEDEPVCIGGFVPQRKGVYRDFMLTTPAAWGANWYPITRTCRRAMDAILHSEAHRVECVVPAARLKERPELAKWYKVLKYNEEATLYGYCANGGDAVIFSRVQH